MLDCATYIVRARFPSCNLLLGHGVEQRLNDLALVTLRVCYMIWPSYHTQYDRYFFREDLKFMGSSGINSWNSVALPQSMQKVMLRQYDLEELAITCYNFNGIKWPHCVKHRLNHWLSLSIETWITQSHIHQIAKHSQFCLKMPNISLKARTEKRRLWRVSSVFRLLSCHPIPDGPGCW